MNFGLRVNTRYSCQIVEKAQISNFTKNPFSVSRVVLCEQTGRRTNMTKLIVVFRNFAKAPKNEFKIRH